MYWTLVLPAEAAIIALNVNDYPLNPLVVIAIWITALTAEFTAVYTRAKMLGRRPWLWLILTMIPIMLIKLGKFDKVVDTRPPPEADLPKTAAFAFVGACAFAFVLVTLYSMGGSSQPLRSATSQYDDGGLTYSYSRIGDRAMIHATGKISFNEADAFNAWTASLPAEQQASIRVGMTTLVLDSNGGNIEGATKMMNWVKDNQIDTIVPNGATCASACVMIWGAGAHKTIWSTSKIGVHGASAYIASNDQRVAVEALGTVAMARTLAGEKAPPAVVAAVTTTSSSDMHWLTADDAVAWGATILDKDGNPES
jgi:ATP-dependent protease ClpP protease subunit